MDKLLKFGEILNGILKIDTPEKLDLWITLSPEEKILFREKYEVLIFEEAYLVKERALKEEHVFPPIKDTYLKDKAKKPKVTLLCPYFLEELSKLMTYYYPEKFVNNDYRKQKRDRELYLDAIHRHLLCIIKGEEVDTEDNTPHIVKIASNCMMYYNNHLTPTK